MSVFILLWDYCFKWFVAFSFFSPVKIWGASGSIRVIIFSLIYFIAAFLFQYYSGLVLFGERGWGWGGIGCCKCMYIYHPSFHFFSLCVFPLHWWFPSPFSFNFPSAWLRLLLCRPVSWFPTMSNALSLCADISCVRLRGAVSVVAWLCSVWVCSVRHNITQLHVCN